MKLIRGGMKVEEVNVGGMHAEPGRVDAGAGVHVTAEDVAAFDEMAGLGVIVYVQDVPANPRRPLPEMGDPAEGVSGG